MAILIGIGIQLALLAGLFLMLEIGFRLSKRDLLHAGSSHTARSVATMVQTLVALLIAFTFSDASQRLNDHRRVILDEVNALEGAWLRVDLLPSSVRAEVRDLLRKYVDARVRAQQALPHLDAFEREVAAANEIFNRLWGVFVIALEHDPANRVLVFPILDAVAEAADEQYLTVRTHVTGLTVVFMLTLVTLSALLVGTTARDAPSRGWPHRIVYAVAISFALHVIIDMEYPRTGIAATRAADDLLLQVRDSWR